MPEPLTFHMGKFPAVLPAELLYARNHMWARAVESQDGLAPGCKRWRFGFTSYAIRLMQDVYFLDWSISAGDDVTLLQEIGHIETSKAESDLFAPFAGRLERFNDALLKGPEAINVDGYGAGWLFDLAGDPGGLLMDAAAYHQFLADNWEKTQRLIKGKFNEE